MVSPSPTPAGKVYLVGAGPGDPGLITLRGVECLERADVVLYDYLVNPRILRHARSVAELICLGRHGQGRIWSQLEINQKLVELTRAGKTVVRLKGGDPAIFARGADEIEALVDAGAAFEVVPGVTTALAAASYAGIPVTHRQLASAVALVTGQEDREKESPALDFAALARFPGTLVFYMGVTTSRTWTAKLMQAGMPPQTPAAIVRRCSLADQTLAVCTLEEVAARLDPRNKIRPPVIVILGDVVHLAPKLSWFETRPLFGQSVLVTRPRHQAPTLARLLEEQGAEVLLQPAIEITEPTSWTLVDEAVGRLDRYDWLVFASANGVAGLLHRVSELGRDLRSLGGLRLAAIGPGTAKALSRYHLSADLQPAEFRAEALADALADHAPGQRFLLVRASRGREVLSEQLRAAGGLVDQIVVYNSVDVTAVEADVMRRLEAGQVDWVTVTSSAIAGALVKLLGHRLHGCRLASMSPVTSQTLRGLGYEPAVEAQRYTMEGLTAAILAAARPANSPRSGD